MIAFVTLAPNIFFWKKEAEIMATCNFSCSIFNPARAATHVSLTPSKILTVAGERTATFMDRRRLSSGWRGRPPVVGSSPGGGGFVDDGVDDGVSLGTLKLPGNTDLPRFESLLFQWANSLCQGADLRVPVPLKVDRISGGARLGFVTIRNGKAEITVYIDFLVFPATEGSGPIFRAIRNGPMKDNPPPDEPRIMRSLLQALQRSVEIARL